MSEIQLLRPCPSKFPDGVGFGVFGEHWGYHFDDRGLWVKGKVNHLGRMCGQHGGRDIVCPEGTPLVAPAAGRILHAGWQDAKDPKRGYGKCVMIDLLYPHGKILTLGHFSDVAVKSGQNVAEGEFIGKSGNTGNVVGNGHCHVQLEIAGDYPRIPLNFEWTEV